MKACTEKLNEDVPHEWVKLAELQKKYPAGEELNSYLHEKMLRGEYKLGPNGELLVWVSVQDGVALPEAPDTTAQAPSPLASVQPAKATAPQHDQAAAVVGDGLEAKAETEASENMPAHEPATRFAVRPSTSAAYAARAKAAVVPKGPPAMRTGAQPLPGVPPKVPPPSQQQDASTAAFPVPASKVVTPAAVAPAVPKQVAAKADPDSSEHEANATPPAQGTRLAPAVKLQATLPDEAKTAVPAQATLPHEAKTAVPAQATLPHEAKTAVPAQATLPHEAKTAVPAQATLPDVAETAVPAQATLPHVAETAVPAQAALPNEAKTAVPAQATLPNEAQTAIPSQATLPEQASTAVPMQATLSEQAAPAGSAVMLHQARAAAKAPTPTAPPTEGPTSTPTTANGTELRIAVHPQALHSVFLFPLRVWGVVYEFPDFWGRQQLSSRPGTRTRRSTMQDSKGSELLMWKLAWYSLAMV